MIFTPLESGKSVEGAEVEAFKSDVNHEKYLYLMAGTHGDEVEGVYVLKKLFEWLKSDHLISDLPIVVLPILNIDGYCAQRRINSHSVDLNRNYPTGWKADFKKEKNNPGSGPLSEPENQYLVKLFDKFPPGFVISFHSWKPILNFNGNAQDVAEYLSSYNQYETADDIGYPCPGSLGSFVPTEYSAGVLTYECPVLAEGKSLEEIWNENEEGLKNLLQSDLVKKKIGFK